MRVQSNKLIFVHFYEYCPPAFARWNVASQNIIIFLYDFIKKSLIFCFRRSISASRLWRSCLFLPSPAGCAGDAVERFRQFPAVPQGGESAGLLFSFVRAGFWCIANLLTVFSALCVIRKISRPTFWRDREIYAKTTGVAGGFSFYKRFSCVLPTAAPRHSRSSVPVSVGVFLLPVP